MGLSRFVEGCDRRQATLLPECLDDYVAEENPVRVVDVFVDDLDLDALGFEGMTSAATGRPDYHPAMLLKLYVYGYLNKTHGSAPPRRHAPAKADRRTPLRHHQGLDGIDALPDEAPPQCENRDWPPHPGL